MTIKVSLETSTAWLVTSVGRPLCGKGVGRAGTDNHTRRVQLPTLQTWGILGYFEHPPQTQQILLIFCVFTNRILMLSSWTLKVC